MFKYLSLIAAALLCLACSKPATEPVATNTKTPEVKQETPAPAQVATTEISPELAAKLVLADALDGTEDKVVSKCASCALHMDGKAEHPVTLGDYSLHMCSTACQTNYADNPGEKLLAVTIPGN